MSILESPYINDEAIELESFSQDEPSFTKHQHSPFLTNEFFIEGELEEELSEISKEVVEDEEFDDDPDYESLSGEYAYDDEVLLDEFEENDEDEIEGDFLGYEDEVLPYLNVNEEAENYESNYEQDEYSDTLNLAQEIANEAFETASVENTELEFEGESDFEDELEFEELYDDELEADKLLDDELASNKIPIAIPVNKSVPFAANPSVGSYWPLISTHQKNKEVAFQYMANPSRYVGNRSRSFLAKRLNGKRYHAGIDLYAHHKDKVVACEDGVIRAFYHFYRNTYALIVEHKNLVINYGEVHKDSLDANGLKKGDNVSAGQVIAHVGKMHRSSMLHFETYRKGTEHNIKWFKKDSAPPNLLNPTKYLLALQEHGNIANSRSNNLDNVNPDAIPKSTNSSLSDIIQKGKKTIENIFQSGKLISVALAIISKGIRDENKITNAVFYAKYPLKKGYKLKKEDPLIKDWIQIRNVLIRPLLQENKGTKLAPPTNTLNNTTTKSNVYDDINQYKSETDISKGQTLEIPKSFGTLTVDTSIPELSNSIPYYKFTEEDARWIARFVTGEAGVKNDANGHAVIWAMFNRFGILRNRYRKWTSFHVFLRLYSTTLQPILNSKGAAQRVWRNHNQHPDRFPIVRGEGTYKGTDIMKVQYKKHIKLQNMSWENIHPAIRRMTVNILDSKIPNPGIGIATEFASTRMYFKQKYRRFPNSKKEWTKFTINYATNRFHRKQMGCTWIGDKPNLNQMKNAFFLDNRFENVPSNAITISQADGI